MERPPIAESYGVIAELHATSEAAAATKALAQSLENNTILQHLRLGDNDIGNLFGK